MVDGNKLGILKSILDWSQAIKQKSVELDKLFIMEYMEKVEKGDLPEYEDIVYSLFEISRVNDEIIEDCLAIKYNLNKKHSI